MSEYITPHQGGCFCGNIRFAFDAANVPVANCHCTMCRKLSGAPFVTWLVVPEARFRYTANNPMTLKSSEHGTRYFCDKCGTPIACINTSHPEIIDVTLGCLDNPESFTPTIEVFEDTRLPFIHPIRQIS